MGPIDSKSRKPGHPCRDFIDTLKPKLTPDARIIIRSCYVAMETPGERFIADLAKAADEEVIATDGMYVVMPFGKTVRAMPEKKR